MNALKRLITIGMMVLCGHALAQQTSVTPNVGLQLPAYGSTSWQVPFYFNMNLVDQYLGGQKQFPFPNCAGNNGYVLTSTGTGWNCLPLAGSLNGVVPGTQYHIPAYLVGGTTVGQSGMLVDGSGNLTLPAALIMSGATSGSITHTAPPTVTPYTLVWPAAQGGAGQTLVNDGSGNLTWQTGSGATPSLPNYSVQAYNPSGGLTSDPNVTVDTNLHALHANTFCANGTADAKANALCYGADPNGLVTGVDSGNAINAAIAATAQGNTPVVLPAGHYLIKEPLLMMAQFLSYTGHAPGGPHLIGAGSDSTFLDFCFTKQSAGLRDDQAYAMLVAGNYMSMNVTISGNTMTWRSSNQFVAPVIQTQVLVQTGTSSYTQITIAGTGYVNTTTNTAGVSSNVTFASGSPLGTVQPGATIYINGVAGTITGDTNNTGYLNGNNMVFTHDFGTQTNLAWSSADGTGSQNTTTSAIIVGTPPAPGTYTIIWPQPYNPLTSGELKGVTLDGIEAANNGVAGCPGRYVANRSLSEAADDISGIGLLGSYGGGFKFEDVKVQFFQHNGWALATPSFIYPSCALKSNGAGPDCFIANGYEISHSVAQENGGWGFFDGIGFSNSYGIIHNGSGLNQNGKGGVYDNGNQLLVEGNSISLNGCLAGVNVLGTTGFVNSTGTPWQYAYSSGAAFTSLANNEWISIDNRQGQVENLDTAGNTFTLVPPAGSLHQSPSTGTAIPWQTTCQQSQEPGYPYAKSGPNIAMVRAQPSTAIPSVFTVIHSLIKRNELDTAVTACADVQSADMAVTESNNCNEHSTGFGLPGGERPHASWVFGDCTYGSGCTVRNPRSIEDHDRSDSSDTTNSGLQVGTFTTDGAGNVAFQQGNGALFRNMHVNDPIMLQDVNGNPTQYIYTTAPTSGTTQGTATCSYSGGTYTLTSSTGPGFASVQNGWIITIGGYFLTAASAGTSTTLTSTTSDKTLSTASDCGFGGTPQNWAFVTAVVSPSPAANSVAANFGFSLDYTHQAILIVGNTSNLDVEQMEILANSGNTAAVANGGGVDIIPSLDTTGAAVSAQGYNVLVPGYYGRPLTGNNWTGTVSVATGASPAVTITDGTNNTNAMTLGQPVWVTGMNCGDTRWPTQCHIASIVDSTHFTLRETNSGSALTNTAYQYAPPLQPALTFIRGGCTTEPTAYAVMDQQAPADWGWVQDVQQTNAGAGCTSLPFINSSLMTYPKYQNNDNYVKVAQPNTSITPTTNGQSNAGLVQTTGPKLETCYWTPTSSNQPTNQACIRPDGNGGLVVANPQTGAQFNLASVGGPLFDITHYGASTSTADNCTSIVAATNAANNYGSPATVYIPKGHFAFTCSVTLGPTTSLDVEGDLFSTSTGLSSPVRTNFGTGNTWTGQIYGSGSLGCTACLANINIRQYAQGAAVSGLELYGLGGGSAILVGDVVDSGVLPSSNLLIYNVREINTGAAAANSNGIQVISPATGVTAIGNYLSGVQYGVVDNQGGNFWLNNQAKDPGMLKCFYDKTSAGTSVYSGNTCTNPTTYGFHALGTGAVVKNNSFLCLGAPCTDNTATAMFFSTSNPLSELSGNVVMGASGTQRWAQDTNLTQSNMTSSDVWVPGLEANVVTSKIQTILSTMVPGSGSVNATQIQGVNVSSTAPTSNQVLQYNGTAWAPATVSAGGVTSVNSQTGPALTIAGAGTVSVSQSSNTITITGSGGGASFPGTNGLVKNTSTTASVTAAPGTDYTVIGSTKGFSSDLVNYFPLGECSGSTVTDVVGSATASVVSGGTATWTSDCGLKFTGQGTANRWDATGITGGFLTMEIAFVPTFPTSNEYNYPICYAGSASSANAQVCIQLSGHWTGGPGNNSTILYNSHVSYLYAGSSNTNVGSTNVAPAGLQVLTLVLTPSGVAHEYQNGVEVQNYYTAPSFSQTSLTGGYLEFGGSILGYQACSSTLCGFNGTIYGIALYSGSHTATQVQRDYRNWRLTLQTKGVNIDQTSYSNSGNGAQNTSNKPAQIVGFGESVTEGKGLTTTQNYAAVSASTVNSGNAFGIGLGLDSSDIYTMNLELTKLQSAFSPAAQNIAVLFSNANDCKTTSSPVTFVNPAQGATNAMWAMTQTLRNQGWVVLWSSGLSGQYGHGDTGKDQCNPAFRSAARSYGVPFWDIASDPRVGADGASTSAGGATACSGGPVYQADQIHPTQCMQAAMGANLAVLVNRLLYAVPTTTTAATYTITGKEEPLNVNPSAASQAITLPDCIGQTWQQYHITNLQQSGSNTATISPASSSETINGQTSYVLANQKTITLTAINSGDVTAGCTWSVN